MQTVDDPINQTVRTRIRRIRQNKRISVRQAARRCDIPESSYSCMENGFYRISLQNLNKMLAGLGATIEEVWPRRQAPPDPLGAASRGVPQQLDFFRFHEVYNLSECRKAALFVDHDVPRCLYAINVDDEEKLELAEMLEVGLNRGWSFFSRSLEGQAVHLCLLEPVLRPHVGRLIDIYLDLWLASGLVKAEMMAAVPAPAAHAAAT